MLVPEVPLGTHVEKWKNTLGYVLATKSSPTLCTAVPEESVFGAVHRMSILGVGSLVILDSQRRVAGIFTERDALRRILAEERSPRETRLEEVMTRDVVTARNRTTVAEALSLCSENRFRRLPIVERGRPVGVVTLGDLTRWLLTNQRTQITELNDYIWGP